MFGHNMKAVVYGRLDAIAAAEKVTRVELAALSRELLAYVPDTHDIDIVNRLIKVLTPVNRKVAILFFAHFLPWEEEKTPDGTHQRFGKMMKSENTIKRRLDAIAAFLKDQDATIWTWGEKNIEIKKKDFGANISRAIKKAMEGDEKSDTPAISKYEIFQAVLAGGMSLDDMFEAMETASKIAEMQLAAVSGNAEGMGSDVKAAA